MDNNGPPRPSRCRGGGGAGTDRGSPGPPGPWQGPPRATPAELCKPSGPAIHTPGPKSRPRSPWPGRVGASRAEQEPVSAGDAGPAPRQPQPCWRWSPGVQKRVGWEGGAKTAQRRSGDPAAPSKITPHRHPSGESVSSLQMEGVGLPAGCLFPKPLSHFVFMGSLSQMPVHTRCSRWSPTPLSTSPSQGSPHPSSSPPLTSSEAPPLSGPLRAAKCQAWKPPDQLFSESPRAAFSRSF